MRPFPRVPAGPGRCRAPILAPRGVMRSALQGSRWGGSPGNLQQHGTARVALYNGIGTAHATRMTRRKMKCHNCPKPAMYAVGPTQVPLCLDCYEKNARVAAIQHEQAERMINYFTDQIDATFGLPPMGPRFPPRQPA